MAAMERYADAATHHEAAQQCDIRLGIVLDRGVQQIFVAVELDGVGSASPAGIVERTDVAAGAESALACPLDHDALDGAVACPCRQLRLHADAHRMRQCIERLRTVECDQTDGALPFIEDLVRGAHDANAPSKAPNPKRMTEKNVR